MIVFWAEFADSFTYEQLRENCRRNQTFVPLNIVSEKFLDIFVSTFLYSELEPGMLSFCWMID